MKKLIFLFSLFSITLNNEKLSYCDIKGNVVNPGVYEIKENYTIQDVINEAGGLKKDSYTDNINLSKIVKDEMVIYIHNNNEIKEAKELNNCICTPIIKYTECDESIKIPTTTIKQEITLPVTTTTSTTTTQKNISELTTSTTQKTTTKIVSSTTTTNLLNDKININTCTIEELMNLKGLGEVKAKTIIEYRDSNGMFKSIEDLLNIKGIGNKTFENIKDYIEV